MINILGYLAGILVVVSLLPQTIKSWKTKSTRDLSLWRYIVYIIGLILWISYAIIIKNGPVAVMNGIGLLLAISILYLKIKYGLDKKSTSKKMGIGFGIMILKDNKILLGHRHQDPEKASSLMHGEGTWTMPGGKLHFGEDLKKAALRELSEETSLIVQEDNLKTISLTNDIVPDAHFVTIGFLCQKFEGKPKVMEPDEITEWRWFKLNDLPKPMFFPSEKIVKNYLAGEIYKN